MSQIEHPYGDLTNHILLKGNLHTHTTRSDGKAPTQAVLDLYASREYDFLMLSDHDIYTGQADYDSLDARKMILIPGNEVTAHGVHILHVGADRKIEPDPQRQIVLNQIAENLGFSIIAHPNWQLNFDHCTIDQLTEWVGYTGIEIYNGTCGWQPGSPYATNKWDQLLSAGRRIWGYANDDHHGKIDDVALGWNMVWANDRSAASVVDALSCGRCYASSGVRITAIAVNDMTLRIETDNAHRIVALRDNAHRFAVHDDSFIEVEVPRDARYVRFECWGVGESKAWTQPFFIVEK